MKTWVKKTLKITAIILAVLLLLGWGLKYVLLDRAPAIPETSNFVLDFDEIRTLALEADSLLPTHLNMLNIATGSFPRGAVIAGQGFDPHTLQFSALQLVFKDGTIIIDPVHDTEIHAAYFGGDFDEANYQVQQKALLEARQILITHEHIDHVGGILLSPHLDAIRERVYLTQEQVNGLLADEEVISNLGEDLVKSFEPLSYETYHAVAPGVVLIKASGHTVGTQMIFLRFQGGQELLLVGDIVWHMDNVRLLTGRPLLTNLIGGEDREALAHQLRTLADVHTSGEVQLLVAHDKAQHEDLMARGILGNWFE